MLKERFFLCQPLKPAYNCAMSPGAKGADGPPQNRYYPRIETEILLAYRAPGASEDESRVVKSKSLGLGGLMFEVDHPLPVGSSYHLDLVLADGHMQVNARVVYARKLHADAYQVGFSFIDLTEEQRERLMNFFLEEYEKLPPETL